MVITQNQQDQYDLQFTDESTDSIPNNSTYL